MIPYPTRFPVFPPGPSYITPLGTGKSGGSSHVEQNLRTYVLHQITLQLNKAFLWALCARFRGNEARSDHDFAVSLAIPCVRNMLRERWYSMRRPWVITACPPVRERRRRCWYAAPFRRFARLISIIGCIWPYSSAVSAAHDAPGLRFTST